MDPNQAQKRAEPKREVLEIPSQTSLEQKLLLRQPPPPSKPAISAPPPSSYMLGRLRAFLPQMEQANRDLLSGEAAGAPGFEEPPEGTEGPVVELDLACGLFELKSDDAVAAAERALVSGCVAVESYNNDESDDDSGSDSGSDVDDDSGDREFGGQQHSDIEVDEAQQLRSSTGRRKKQRHPGIKEIE